VSKTSKLIHNDEERRRFSLFGKDCIHLTVKSRLFEFLLNYFPKPNSKNFKTLLWNWLKARTDRPSSIHWNQHTDDGVPKSDTVCTRVYIKTHRLRCNFLFLSKIGLSSLSFPSLRFGAQGVVPSSFPFSENYFTLHLWLSSDLKTDSIFRLLLMGQLMTICSLIQQLYNSDVWLSHQLWNVYFFLLSS